MNSEQGCNFNLTYSYIFIKVLHLYTIFLLFAKYILQYILQKGGGGRKGKNYTKERKNHPKIFLPLGAKLIFCERGGGGNNRFICIIYTPAFFLPFSSSSVSVPPPRGRCHCLEPPRRYLRRPSSPSLPGAKENLITFFVRKIYRDSYCAIRSCPPPSI